MQRKNSFKSTETDHQKFAQAAQAGGKTLSEFYRNSALMSADFIGSNPQRAKLLEKLFKFLNGEAIQTELF